MATPRLWRVGRGARGRAGSAVGRRIGVVAAPTSVTQASEVVAWSGLVPPNHSFQPTRLLSFAYLGTAVGRAVELRIR
jgi:hypothetical protein